MRHYLQNDRAAQLKNLTTLTAFVAGFAMASFLQFGFSDDSVGEGVLMAFGITTALVVSSWIS